MATLTEPERASIWQRFMEAGNSPGSVTKADVRAAVDAIDNWIDTNATAINLTFPTAFRSAASASQKAMVVAYVAWKRSGGGSL